MTFTILGLGNPGEEYSLTRHNTGRIMLEYFRAAHNFPDWKADKKSSALISKGTIGKGSKAHTVVLVAPETFMNKSGVSAKNFATSAKVAECMLVIHDDLDLPFGANKMSFNKSSGGHRGIESIIKSIKTEAFPRIRIGISPTGPAGKIKKPIGEEKVNKVILGEFAKDENIALKKLSKKVNEALEIWVRDGREIAMNFFN